MVQVHWSFEYTNARLHRYVKRGRHTRRLEEEGVVAAEEQCLLRDS